MKQFQIFAIFTAALLCFTLTVMPVLQAASFQISDEKAATKNSVIDDSQAGSDGPYVFYVGERVEIKSIVKQDTFFVGSNRIVLQPKDLTLTCTVDETGDSFTVPLKKKLENETEYTFPLADKMLVISDIEGNFGGFKQMLQGAGVIDAKFKWTYGKGRLVLTGDFFDRGLNVTEVLWLVYKLEDEAKKAGGKLHFILGNHEIMNLQGDTRYVRQKYFRNAELLGMPYEDLFGKNTELGRWLRTKNVFEKIGEYGFCHAGISTQIINTGLTFSEINKLARQYADQPEKEIKNEDAVKILCEKTGIVWYRGMARIQADPQDVEAALRFADVKKLVIGHTLMADVTASYGGKVICIDLYHAENYRIGLMKTLFIEKGDFYVLNDKGEKEAIFAIAVAK